MVTCNVISPQVFWFKKARTSIPILFVMSIVINIGMWFERFVIIVTSLHRDFLPSSWGYFTPTIWDVSCLLGSFGLFFTMFCLFVRFLPMVATAEVKTVLPQANPHGQPGPGHEIKDPPSRATPCPRRWRSSLPKELPDAAPRPAAPEGAPLRNPRRIRDAGGPLSRVRAGA